MMRDEYDFRKGAKGSVGSSSTGKTRITIRIDTDVLNWFKDQVHRAGGGSYQRLINTALCQHIAESSEPLEATLRRILREELKQEG